MALLNSSLGKRIARCTACLSCNPTENQFQNFSEKTPPKEFAIYSRCCPPHHKIYPKSSTSVPCCTIPTVQFPSNYLLHIPTFLPCYHPTFTRRTSGHCLRTFRAVNWPHPLPAVTSVVRLTASSSLLLTLLSFVMLQSAKQEQDKWQIMSYLNHTMSEKNQSAPTHDSAGKINHHHNRLKKSKAVPLQARSRPDGSRKLRFPDFVTTA